MCLTLYEDIYKISQCGQKGKPEETVTDGGLCDQGPDVSLSHTSEVGVSEGTNLQWHRPRGLLWLGLVAEGLHAGEDWTSP